MGKMGVLCLFLVTVIRGNAQFLSGPFDRPAGVNWETVRMANFAVERGVTNRPSGETVSAVRLIHKPPRRARMFFDRGMKDASNLLCSRAAAEFQQALILDPQFSEAYGNLGVEYFYLGRLEDAASALRRAAELDSATSTHHSNLAYVLIHLGRRAEAEREAQTAVDLDAANSRGQLMLGFLLAAHPEMHRQAALHLAEASREFPEAYAVLSDMYRAEGDGRMAALEFEQYRKAISNGRTHSQF